MLECADLSPDLRMSSHVYSIVQMYGLIWLTDLRNKMDSVDLLIMLTSAVCHDLDHTGYNNAYQVLKSPPSSHHTCRTCNNLLIPNRTTHVATCILFTTRERS